MGRLSIMRILMVFAATAILVDMVVAVDYTVGSPNGAWDLSTNLSEWASSQSFSVGDNLDFQFTSTHDVLEVTKENYDSCGLGSPISTTVTSPARFPLTSEGSRYFICGRGAHCSQGMKVQIDVGSTAAPAPPQTTPPSSPTPPQTTPPSSTPPANGPTTASPPPPVRGVIVDPPSLAMSLKMTTGMHYNEKQKYILFFSTKTKFFLKCFHGSPPWQHITAYSSSHQLFQFSCVRLIINHVVVEVTKEKFGSCVSGSPIATILFPLMAAGSPYFMCSIVSSIYQLMMLLIVKVTEANYGSCGTGNAISKTDISPTTIPLTAAGSRYFSSGPW
ncbi:Cupredoxin [Artemisia annua]|uniref:Cupredoxin n=1 Tax=Artemisia annua TaxID=35608 RepID=A0A2U1NLC0_ARTAN|nr:Cupredoxin [Artemisia annua]